MSAIVLTPASSANLGPGFDTLGLALGLHNQIEVRPSDRLRYDCEGEGADTLPRDDANLVLRAYRAVAEARGRDAPPAHLCCTNRIPLARGLGSSAAAVVGGALAACAALDVKLEPAEILRIVLPLEGHPDNLAACLLGGLTVGAMGPGGAVLARRLPLKPLGPLAIVIPSVEVATSKAREALPDRYLREDAAFNLQRTALLIAALAAGERTLLSEALEDRLHQPHRRHLYPGIEAVESAARDHGAAGMCVSGAGPTMLAFPQPGVEASALAEGMAAAWRAAGVEARGLALEVDAAGARITR